MSDDAYMFILLVTVFIIAFALGWFFLPAPALWGQVLALLAAVNAGIALGVLYARHVADRNGDDL